MLRNIRAPLLVGLAFLAISCEQPLPALHIAAWGNIAADGTIEGSSGNFTATRRGEGYYEIQWANGISITKEDSIVDVAIGGVGISYEWIAGVDLLNIFLSWDDGSPVDYDFSFIVYQW
jgi:hypothetical protein